MEKLNTTNSNTVEDKDMGTSTFLFSSVASVIKCNTQVFQFVTIYSIIEEFFNKVKEAKDKCKIGFDTTVSKSRSPRLRSKRSVKQCEKNHGREARVQTAT